MEATPQLDRFRGPIFLAVLCWMVLIPILGQEFGVRRWWTHDWGMFGGAGVGLIDARFVDGASGKVLNRQSLTPPAGFRKSLGSDAEVLEAVTLVCRALGPAADVRVVSRQAQREGWRPMRDGTRNLCPGPNAR